MAWNGCAAARADRHCPLALSARLMQTVLHVQSLLSQQGTGGDHRDDARHAGLDRQSAAAARHLSGLFRPHRAQFGGRPRAYHGALGHAITGLRAEGPQVRSRHYQCAQRGFAALAALAQYRAALCRALHQLLGKRSAGGWLAPAGVVCPWRGTAIGDVCRYLDALDLGAQGERGRDPYHPS